MTDHRKLTVWHKSIELTKSIYRLTAQLPDYERFGLRSQLNRAVVSVPSNIAEGCGKSSNKHFKVYLENSIRSLYEIETQLIIVKANALAASTAVDEILQEVYECQRMLRSFYSKVK